MKKAFVLLCIIALLAMASAAGFYWWQSQRDVRELNKTLPKGVRVTKSFLGNKYFVVNDIDGYSFKVPKGLNGIGEIEYMEKREEMGFIGSSIFLAGNNRTGRFISIDKFEIGETYKTLEDWIQSFFDTFGLEGSLIKANLNDLNILKTVEEKHLGGTNIYFFEENQKIYIFTGGSEEFIQEIILNGKW